MLLREDGVWLASDSKRLDCPTTGLWSTRPAKAPHETLVCRRRNERLKEDVKTSTTLGDVFVPERVHQFTPTGLELP